MDNVKNTNVTDSKSKEQRGQIKSKFIPVYIIKKDSNNSKVIGQKKLNFQANYGRTYHLDYKFFTPKGFHLAKNSKSRYTFKYDKDGLSLNSITFVYDQDGSKDNTAQQPKHQPQPIDLKTKQKPAKDQNDKVKPVHVKSDSSKNHPVDSLEQRIQKNVTDLEHNLHEYDCNVAVQLIHEVLHHDLKFFKTVITAIFTKMKYRSINNLKLDSRDHKISGVIKKYLYNNNQVNFTFVRAKQCDINHQITITEVRDFVTSVIDHNSSKGIFITTSHFTADAQKEAERHSIILIDATRLARLMIHYDVGVKSRRVFRIVNLDKDFF